MKMIYKVLIIVLVLILIAAVPTKHELTQSREESVVNFGNLSYHLINQSTRLPFYCNVDGNFYGRIEFEGLGVFLIQDNSSNTLLRKEFENHYRYYNLSVVAGNYSFWIYGENTTYILNNKFIAR